MKTTSLPIALLLCTLASQAAQAMPAATVPVPSLPDSTKFNPANVTDEQLLGVTAPNWTIPQTTPDFRSFILPPPPTNTSAQTKLEMEELNLLALTRKYPQVRKTIQRWNFDPPAASYNYYFDHLSQVYAYSPPLVARCGAMLNSAIYTGLLAAWNNKFTYLRPRPDQMTSYIFNHDVNLPTPEHPAYPSGHATSAGVFMAVGPSCYPSEPVENFVALGREASLARRQGGVHFFSDSTAGQALGYAIGSAYVTNFSTDGSPLGGNTAAAVYSRPPSADSNGIPTSTLDPAPSVTITQYPVLSADRTQIILSPLLPFPTPDPVLNPPAKLFKIQAVPTTELVPNPQPLYPKNP